MSFSVKRFILYFSGKLIALTALLLLTAHNIHAADLHEVYAMAEKSDPRYRQAEAAMRAIQEQRPQAMAGLLPTVALSANTRKNYQDVESSGFGSSGDISFNSYGYALDASQPIYRRDRFLQLKLASSAIQQAEAQLVSAQHDLIIRVAERYFDILASNDNLDFARSEKKSLSRRLEQAQQRFEVGLTAITDVQEARAGHDRAVAQEISAENSVDNAREALREIIGNYLFDFTSLGEDMPLLRPQPEDIDTWTKAALEQNPDVMAATHAVDAARKEIKIQNAGHFPTLDLFARRDFSKSGGRFGDTEVTSSIVGLELNVPIYQGGLVSSRGRVARQRFEEQMQRLEQARRQAQRLAREAYLGVISGISHVQALKQAVISSETALQATVAGFEVGTRTAVDVVGSEQVTFQARRDYSKTRYDYILNTLRLKRASGSLSPADLAALNQWLN